MKFNLPIERVAGQRSAYTGWTWLVVGAVIALVIFVGWASIAGIFFSPRSNKEKSLVVSENPSDQKLLGYIKKIYTVEGNLYVDVDPVEWLTGSLGSEAARQDGVCPPEIKDCLPNGFYLRNRDTTAQTFLLNPQAQVFMQTLTTDKLGNQQWDQQISTSDWQKLFTVNPPASWFDVPFHLVVHNNEIEQIREQYVP